MCKDMVGVCMSNEHFEVIYGSIRGHFEVVLRSFWGQIALFIRTISAKKSPRSSSLDYFPVSFKINVSNRKSKFIIPSSWVLSSIVISIMVSRKRIKCSNHTPTKSKIICRITHVTADIWSSIREAKKWKFQHWNNRELDMIPFWVIVTVPMLNILIRARISRSRNYHTPLSSGGFTRISRRFWLLIGQFQF